MAIGGHVSPKMLAHYSHVRLQAKRTALDALSMTRPQVAKSGGETGGYDTNNDTNQKELTEQLPQITENMVSAAGFEPATHALKVAGSCCGVSPACTDSITYLGHPNCDSGQCALIRRLLCTVLCAGFEQPNKHSLLPLYISVMPSVTAYP